jgi:hypothetical protein
MDKDWMRDIPSYSYARFRWIRDVNVDREAKRLSAEFDVRLFNTPVTSESEVAIHKTTRKEYLVKADTLSAFISTFRAILFQKEQALFTARDMKLRQEILDLYPRRSATPIPIGSSYEPMFYTEESEI